MDRRRFFKLGTGGAAVLAGAGAFRWFASGYSSQLEANDFPIILSEKEFVIMKAVIETLLPAADGFPSGVSIGLPQRLDEEIWALSDRMRGDLKDGLQVLEHGPLLYGYWGRFTSLSSEDRTKCYENFLTGSNDLLQQISGGVKTMVHFFYYSNPGIWPKIGYTGPFIETPLPAASRAAYSDLLRRKKGIY